MLILRALLSIYYYYFERPVVLFTILLNIERHFMASTKCWSKTTSHLFILLLMLHLILLRSMCEMQFKHSLHVNETFYLRFSLAHLYTYIHVLILLNELCKMRVLGKHVDMRFRDTIFRLTVSSLT